MDCDNLVTYKVDPLCPAKDNLWKHCDNELNELYIQILFLPHFKRGNGQL